MNLIVKKIIWSIVIFIGMTMSLTIFKTIKYQFSQMYSKLAPSSLNDDSVYTTMQSQHGVLTFVNWVFWIVLIVLIALLVKIWLPVFMDIKKETK
jgi:hypothetical protein